MCGIDDRLVLGRQTQMRIDISSPAVVTESGSHVQIVGPRLLKALDGLEVKIEPELSMFLDERLVDLGVVGGRITLHESAGGLRVSVVYRSPDPLDRSALDMLLGNTMGQW